MDIQILTTYFSDWSENGDIILTNEEINNLRLSLMEIPELVTVHNYDESIEYIDNQEIATKRLEENNLFKENPFTRAVTRYIVNSSNLIVYNEKNYKGTSRSYNNTVSVTEFWRIPQAVFSPASFKLSGTFKVYEIGKYPTATYKRACAIFYAGANYTGKSSRWAIDNNLKAQNISSGGGASLRVIWEN